MKGFHCGGIGKKQFPQKLTGLKKTNNYDFAQSQVVSVGSLCPAPNNGSLWQNNTIGYYMHKTSKVIGFIAETPKYINNADDCHLRFQIKRCTMNALRTTDITMSTGDNIINLDLIVPNTGNVYAYCFGNYWNKAALDANNISGVIGLQFGGEIPAGWMLFIAHCNISAGATFYGSKCRIILEES